MNCWANGTSRISESFCRTDVEFLFFFFHQHQCDQTECVFICCVWASVFGLVIDGPACCLWHCMCWIIARVVAADLRPAGSRELWWTHRCPSVSGRNIMKPRGHSKLEQSEKESHIHIAPHHKVMKVSNHEQEKFNDMTNLWLTIIQPMTVLTSFRLSIIPEHPMEPTLSEILTLIKIQEKAKHFLKNSSQKHINYKCCWI